MCTCASYERGSTEVNIYYYFLIDSDFPWWWTTGEQYLKRKHGRKAKYSPEANQSIELIEHHSWVLIKSKQIMLVSNKKNVLSRSVFYKVIHLILYILSFFIKKLTLHPAYFIYLFFIAVSTVFWNIFLLAVGAHRGRKACGMFQRFWTWLRQGKQKTTSGFAYTRQTPASTACPSFGGVLWGFRSGFIITHQWTLTVPLADKVNIALLFDITEKSEPCSAMKHC